MEQAPMHRRPFSEILEAAGPSLGDNIERTLAETKAPVSTGRSVAGSTPSGPIDPIKRGIEQILAERGTTHGDFTDNAFIMQRLKEIVHASKNWTTMTDVQREALHMILHKVGRICSGNPDVHDHWDDIAGYAKLVSERI